MVQNTQHRGYIGSRSTYNTRIQRFWREHNVNVMIHFRDKYPRLEALLNLDSDDKTGLCLLHYAFMDIINQEIDVFKRHYDQHPLSISGQKIHHNLWITRSFNNQVKTPFYAMKLSIIYQSGKTHLLLLSMDQQLILPFTSNLPRIKPLMFFI